MTPTFPRRDTSKHPTVSCTRCACTNLHQVIRITRKNGSFTLEESLARLVKEGAVKWKDAHVVAAHVEEFEQLVPQPPM